MRANLTAMYFSAVMDSGIPEYSHCPSYHGQKAFDLN